MAGHPIQLNPVPRKHGGVRAGDDGIMIRTFVHKAQHRGPVFGKPWIPLVLEMQMHRKTVLQEKLQHLRVESLGPKQVRDEGARGLEPYFEKIHMMQNAFHQCRITDPVIQREDTR